MHTYCITVNDRRCDRGYGSETDVAGGGAQEAVARSGVVSGVGTVCIATFLGEIKSKKS